MSCEQANTSTAHQESQSYQDSFIRILHEITQLQWVRESMPAHSKNHANLVKKHKKVLDAQTALEHQLQSADPRLHEELQDRLVLSQERLASLEHELDEAEEMMNDLMQNKCRLNAVCEDLHRLYDELASAMSGDSSYTTEQNLRNEVKTLEDEIPKIEFEMHRYAETQEELKKARDAIEAAMTTLPGSTSFLDQQVLANHGISIGRSFFGTASSHAAAHDPSSFSTLQDARKLAEEASFHAEKASNVCSDFPKIPSVNDSSEDVATLLIKYRTYRAKIESLLRTQINPRYNQLQMQLAVSKYHLEQKTIEWIDQQVLLLETILRENGVLDNVNLEGEIARLRMGSNAAIAAVAAEASGRVTVDDVLEVGPPSVEVERNGPLPEYTEYSKDTEQGDLPVFQEQEHEQDHGPGQPSSSSSVRPALPAYSSHAESSNRATAPSSSSNFSMQTSEQEDQPPAYSM